MVLWAERVRVARRLARAEEELQQAFAERDAGPEARTRWLRARDEHQLASGEARTLLTIISAGTCRELDAPVALTGA